MTVLGLAVLLVMVLLGGAFAMDRVRIANRVRLQRVYAAQAEAADLFGLLRDMETGQRAYLPTGNTLFLQPYTTAVQAYPGLAAEFRATVRSVDVPGADQDLAAFETAANTWRASTDATLAQRAVAPLDAQTLQTVLLGGKQRFDDVRSRYAALSTTLETQRQALSLLQDRYYTMSLVLLVMTAGTTLATLGYGIALLRRVQFLAGALQGRQDRQEAYTQVISALNGPQQLAPLLESVLPQLADSIGAHAAVVYVLQGEQLIPAQVAGFNSAALPSLRTGEGLPGRALREDRLLLLQQDAANTALPIATGLGSAPPHSVAYVPLRYGQQRLGVLLLASLQPFTAPDLQQLKLTASQLATAISTVHAFESTQQLAGELAQQNERLAQSLETSETLQDIGRELVVESDLQTVLTMVCSEARRLLRADYTAVATLADAHGSTRWVAVDGVRSERWHEYVSPPHQGTAGRAIDTGAPVVIDTLHDGMLPPEEIPVHMDEGMRAVAGVPLFRGETPIGALIVGYRRAHAITAGETALAQSLASYASIAIENARLLNELQRERDVAEQRACEVTAKNQEVERANRLKSEFLANMSHELRTPLNSILALSQILGDRLDGDLTVEQAKQVEIIERNGHNLLRLINDILDLSKIEAGRVELNVTLVSVGELVGAVRSTVAPLAAKKGLVLRTGVAADVPLFRTDETKLKQVLLNLLSNAIKFTEQGSVTVRVSHGRPQDDPADAPSQWLTFEVQDTGVGIAPADQATVWEEFRQIDGSLSRRYEGTGLGLAIVRRLVHLLGGDIGLDSLPNQGSTFRFSLPLTLSAQPTAPAPGPPAPRVERTDTPVHQQILVPPTKPLVLVVDDDIEVIYILEKYLRDEGYQIEVAQTGDDAIRKAQQLHPFAITLDVALPGRDGWDVIDTLKSDPTTSAIPIIVISMLDNRQFGYQLGATDYLVKPVNRADLLQRLEQVRKHATALDMALVVDDDPVQQDVVARTLRDAGIQVHTCSNGAGALQWLDEHTPDLLTLDLMMPGMDGFDVLEAVHARPHLHDVPVLVITAKDIDGADRQRLNGRIAAIIHKGPQQRDALLRELAERLRAQQRSPAAQPA